MIRDKAIYIKLKLLHLSDQQIYDTAVSGFGPSVCTCPACGAKGRFKQIQPYERHMISVDRDVRTDTVLSVRRFLCESCGHTHALLPDILIPFGSYSLRFVLTILDGYLKRSGSVADFCESWQIAVSTLYGWIHLFASHYNAWCQALDRVTWVCRDALEVVSHSPHFHPVSWNASASPSSRQQNRHRPSGGSSRIGGAGLPSHDFEMYVHFCQSYDGCNDNKHL